MAGAAGALLPVWLGAPTLDVLSGGRAWLGIGAAWNEREARGLGVPFPPIKTRFEMLEETLQMQLLGTGPRRQEDLVAAWSFDDCDGKAGGNGPRAAEVVGKPACVFTSSGSMHGGNEATLLTMMLPLIHHGMVIAGIPFTEAELGTTLSGGTPYGASHVAGDTGNSLLSDAEGRLAFAQGRRLAILAEKLGRP